MARVIKEIQNDMVARLRTEHPNLSTSKTAEWRLWSYVVAAAIHSFELIVDLFRREMEQVTGKMAGGTKRWYAGLCYRFQNGHKILFDGQTAATHYAKDDPAARIIKVAAITVRNRKLFIKVAKFDEQGTIVPLSLEELHNFSGYIAAVKYASDETEVVSTAADQIRYDLEVFYDPAVPRSVVEEQIGEALAAFRTTLSFDAVFYAQRLVDIVMAVDGVMTVDLRTLARQGADTAGDFVPVPVMAELQSGYFEYADTCTLTLTPVNAE